MEASVIGKTLTPLSSQYISLFERTNHSPIGIGHLPSSRRSSFLTPSIRTTPRLTLTKDKDAGTWYPELSTPKTTVSRSNSGNSDKSLSEHDHTILSVGERRNVLGSVSQSGSNYCERMPKTETVRAKSGKISRNFPLIPLSSARSITPEITLSKPSMIRASASPRATMQGERKTENNLVRYRKAPSYPLVNLKERKRRKKSGKKRKFTHVNADDSKYRTEAIRQKHVKECQSVLICKPTEICSRTKLLPQRTSSFLLLQDMNKKLSTRDDSALPSRCLTSAFSKNTNSSWNPDVLKETLDSSNDSSTRSQRKKDKQLSLRIQLIHKYGSQDVIAKHLELQRKQELADKHRKKVLEVEAASKLKQMQRAKIYALNGLMTKLEKEQFEEYKRSVRV